MLIETTKQFSDWLKSLRDTAGRARILARLKRVQESGHLGVTKTVSGNIKEMKFRFGPGYRVYFTESGDGTIVLLGGGDKSTQSGDIEQVLVLAREFQNGEDKNKNV